MPLMTFLTFLIFLWAIGIALNQFAKQELTNNAQG